MLAKSKLNSLEALISKTLIDSNISNDGFIYEWSAERMWQYKRRNQKFKVLNSLLKILVYI